VAKKRSTNDSLPSSPSSKKGGAPQLLLGAFLNCIKAGLEGDQARQNKVDDVIGQLGASLSKSQLSELLSDLETFSGWLGDAAEGNIAAGRMARLIPHLLKALGILGAGEPWIGLQADALLTGSKEVTDKGYVSATYEFCDRIITQGLPPHEHWQEERRAFLNLVIDFISQLQEMYGHTEQFDYKLSDAISGLRAGKSIEDVQELRDLLIQEAEELKEHTQSVNQQLLDSKGQLAKTSSYMELLEEELIRTRVLSQSDALTGLANRRTFFQTLEQEISRAERHHTPLSLVMFDLDHFKQVNDNFGHQIGDKVLVKVGERASLKVRKSDCLARYGGEEFVLLLPNADLASAAKTAEKIREEIASLCFKTGKETITISASFGVTFFVSGKMDQDSFIGSVDKALYRAKAAGRNRVELMEID